MAAANRIKVTTATTGTGSLTLSATGVRDSTNGDFLAPAEVLTELGGRRIPYFIRSGGSFAHGLGQISADGLTLTRDTDEMSWDGTTYSQALLSLSGTSTMIISPRAVDIHAGSIGVSIMIARGAFTL